MSAGRLKLIACLVAGAILPLAFAPFGLFWLAPVSLAALFWAWRDAAPKQALRLGFAHGCAGFLGGIYWIYISVHDFGGAPAALAVFLMLGLVAVMSCYVAGVGWAAARWFGTSGSVSWLVALPALWVVAEWLRGFVLSGFGWLSLGYSQTDSWLMGFAPLLGLHGMSWAVALTAGAGLQVAFARGSVRALGLVVIAALWGGGYLATGHSWTAPKGQLRTVALVQGAVSQDRKWLAEQLPVTMALYRRLTLEHLGAEFIVWPEAAIPALESQVGRYLREVSERVASRGGTLMLGALRARGPTQEYQNALIAPAEPSQVYLKRRLVPFGESFPVPDFVRTWMRLMTLPYIDAVPGPAGQPPLSLGGEQIAVMICYDTVFGAEQLHYFPDASLIVTVSNDAWFGASVAPHQHLQIARLRSAEVGRYQLRATNTGLTAVIDPRGQVVAELPQFEPGVLESSVQGFTGATPYVRFGNYPVVLGALLALLAQLAMTKLTMRPGT